MHWRGRRGPTAALSEMQTDTICSQTPVANTHVSQKYKNLISAIFQIIHDKQTMTHFFFN